MEVVDSIYQSWDNHDITMGIFLDLQKAFDTVNYNALLKKLELYGVRGIVLYMSFIFARFFVCVHFFSVSICPLCFFVMGGQLRWANAFTGSLPL